MNNLNWFQAEELALLGLPIRREAWRKWLNHNFALWFIDQPEVVVSGDIFIAASHHVVKNSEFGQAEFLAGDWTTDPWDIPPGGGEPPPWPPPWPPPHGDHWPPYPPTGGGHRWFGPGNPPGGGSVVQPPYPPPGGGGGGGDGPGGGGTERPRTRPPHEPPGGDTPTITVTVTPHDSLPGCYDPLAELPTTLELDVEVSISGGPPGVGTLSVELGGETKLGTGWPGMDQSYSFMMVTFALGGTVTCTVTFNIGGHEYTGTGDYTFPDYCGSSGGDPGP